MKKPLPFILAAFLLALSLNAQAASVIFEPRELTLKIAPGETGRRAITVHGFSSTAYSLNFLVGSRLQNGNLPRAWLTAAYLWLDAKAEGASTCTMDLVVSVPPDAKPGTYSGLLVPDDMRSSESITSKGVIISIEVLSR